MDPSTPSTPGDPLALANALRGLSSAGTFGMMTGVPGLQEAGKAEVGQAGQLGGMVAQAAQHRLNMAMQADYHRALIQAREDAIPHTRIGKDQFGRPFEYDPTLHPGQGTQGSGAIPSPGGGGGAGSGGQVGTLVPGMSDEAAIAAAINYHHTRAFDGLSRGPAGQMQANALKGLERELFPGTDIATDAAGYKANAATMTELQKQLGGVHAFEGMLGKNLGLFEDAAKGLTDTGVKPLNYLVRAGQDALGSAATTKFNQARMAVVTEASRIMNNPRLIGSLTDSARHELSAIIDPNATDEQIKASVALLRQEIANRPAALQGEIDNLLATMRAEPPGLAAVRQRLGLPASNANAAPDPGPSSSAPAPQTQGGAPGDEFLRMVQGK